MEFELKDEAEGLESTGIGFDFKGFLFRCLRFWWLFVVTIGIGYAVAHYINVRKENIYRLESLITVENDQNPFFTSNTSISFNWGGVSDKVGNIITEIKTRRHNELVIDSLQFYKQYLTEGRYRLEELYKSSPFTATIDKNRPQLLGRNIGIRFIDESSYTLFVNFETSAVTCQNYQTKEKTVASVTPGEFSETYWFGEAVTLPFFTGVIELKPYTKAQKDAVYYIRFLNFDSVVNQYKNAINIAPVSREAASVLRLSLVDKNKTKIVDFINATTDILRKTELQRKNLYATNTIEFIDNNLSLVSTDLQNVTDQMNSFRKENRVFNVEDKIANISDQIKDYEQQQLAEQLKLDYLYNLETYLRTKTDYTQIAAPSSVGIEEGNILASVSKITSLAIERQNLQNSIREGSILLQEIDSKINAEKNVLLETIKITQNIIRSQLTSINRKKGQLESQLIDLPEDQQEFLKIQRKLEINRESYAIYQAKKSEAEIVKAANVSDITVIDEAKDIGNGPIGPNKSLNYTMALLIGTTGPLVLLLVLTLLDTTIHSIQDVEKLSSVPILGLIGKSNHTNNLLVFEKPKSAVSEAFRAIRSSLQFFYKSKLTDDDKGRTLMITSSVSGEGKTYCSINIASVYAMSGMKTILLGLDLRKPKIFGDFNIDNTKGIVNYLIDEMELDEVLTKSHIENLDLIPSGPVPPNPSELLMTDKLQNLIKNLRQTYDIIVLDTPPVG
ncbi:MAG: polysaccharide biosynthesis tyrosine autokinase, partial [Winogradskyella sp.]|nr:polysaccharide biosynthesis tyrosine autokinase [Winogradskyella sp.]